MVLYGVILLLSCTVIINYRAKTSIGLASILKENNR